jgi:hypothetical protein
MILAPESAVGKASATIRRQRSRWSLSAWGTIALNGILALAVGAPAQTAEAQRPVVARVHGIATGIAACWRPPHDDDQVTVRASFTREGAVIGGPRIVFVQSSGGRADDAALADSMKAAIRECTPLHFSAQLGSAIAGQVLDIRFIGRSRATIVAPP